MTKARIRLYTVLVLSLTLSIQAVAAVKICRTGGVDVFADNSGMTPASKPFQDCINDNAITVINVPPGIYQVDTPIIVRRSNLILRTAGLSGTIQNCQQLRPGSCATFMASRDPMACINNPGECHTVLNSKGGGLLQARGVARVIFDHLIIDGNRAARGNTESWKNCQNPMIENHNQFGFNVQMSNCEGPTSSERCEFTYNFTRNALCGTAFFFSGNHGRVQGNASFNNGVHTDLLWADGMTIARNNGGIVNDNHLVNNTDVGLILGEASGTGTQIQSNWIEQYGVYAFAAMMIGNFAETGAPPDRRPTGNYTAAMVRFNTINCYGFWCGFGINFGPDPWTPLARETGYPHVFGGTVTRNNINGARVLINFGGAGNREADAPNVTLNTLTGAPTDFMVLRTGSRCKAAPNVVMNLPNNKRTGLHCDNWVNTDASPRSAICFRDCWSNQ